MNRLENKINDTRFNFLLGENDMDAIMNLDRHERFIDAGFWIRKGLPLTLESIWDE